MGLLDSIGKWLSGDDKQCETPVVGRNEPCWCGSGMKYKKCHMDSDAKKQSAKRKINCGTS